MSLSCLPIANHLLRDCRLVNSREDILPFLGEQLVMAEIGVSDGSFSQLLAPKAKFLALLDAYQSRDWPSLGRFGVDNHFDYIKQKFKSSKMVKILRGDPLDLLKGFDDNHFDVIYLDGGIMPNYAVFQPRLFLAYNKVKVGGLIWINDYTTYDPYTKTPYGIQKATNELISVYHLEAQYLSLNNSNFHDLCLKKTPQESVWNSRIPLMLHTTPYGYLFMLKNEEFIGREFHQTYWDEPLLNKILPYLHVDDSVIDVGAHVGCHTLCYARKVKKVYAFEIQSVMVKLLKKNLDINQISHVSVGHYAIGHLNDQKVSISGQCRDGVSQGVNVVYEISEASATSMNYGGLALGVGGESVMMKTLDGFHFKDKIKYLKVDVEGAEPLVFWGARDLIRRDHPLIMYEQRPDATITADMRAIMKIPPEVESFSIEDFCVKELNYHPRVMVDATNFLLIPAHV